MTYHWLIPLTAAVGILALAIIVLRSGGHEGTTRVFPFLALTLVFWNLITFVLYYVGDERIAFSLARVFRGGALFMPPAVAHLVASFRTRQPRWVRTLIALDYGMAALLSLANSCDLLVSGLRRYSWGYYSIGTPLYDVLSIYLVANMVFAFGLLAHAYTTAASPHGRLQLKFWILGAALALPLGLTNLLPAYGVPFYPLGNLGNLAWAGLVAYAIVRHRLMDIDLVVTKGMAYTAVAFVLVAPAFTIMLWLQRISFGQVHPDFSVAVLAMLIAVGVLFPMLRFRAEYRIERSLFREKHDYRVALMAFTRSIVRILDRQRLVRELATTLAETLQLDRIAVALVDEAEHAFAVQYAVGIPPTSDKFPKGDTFIVALSRCQDAVLRDELVASAQPAERSAVHEVCQQNDWQVCIPLTMGSDLIGFISLGRKRNLDAFFAEDLALLGTLAAEASVALENARLYEELKRSQDIIRRADRLSALGTLAAGIAHEVRNPLVSIQTLFQLAPDRLHDEEFFTTFLAMTANEVTRISDLITELLTFARSPTRSLAPVSLNDTVDRVATLLEPEARKHGLQLARELSHNVPPVKADNDQIKQVMINLILNAMQATGPGGVVTVTTRSVQRGSMRAGQFEVSDTGIGMPQEQLDHIFDPFFTTKDKGTGLGLAIVHQIVMEHGGSISVDSRPGVGTSFFVDLPLAEQTGALHGKGEDLAESTPPRYERPRKAIA